MNLFFYVEDAKAGREMFEFLIKSTLTNYTRVRNITQVVKNNYVVESGFGYPSMLGTNHQSPAKNRLGITIDEINKHGSIDYLVMCLDSDGDAEPKIELIKKHIINYESPLKAKLVVFIQNVCAETWLLGIDTLFQARHTQSFSSFANHYNVLKHDPEKMDKPFFYNNTIAWYHFEYLREMAKMSNIVITKSNCKALFTKFYLGRLIHRVDHTFHLESLRSFLFFLRKSNTIQNL